ncbi:phosphotransferase family protein [Paenibacillus sp. PAMC21692]|uniref:phosphotransferase family protein n=1 Tax=Paenibacillus sp. PAMC21692 TaxID=2762320 RepID=UPI00164E8E2B|nr:aminoglycoside phosphotransferase family protein [Paenibacillus sp. PAMC21692]QNK56917.1 aminoglycoside phosphotransferase family protein [Paenibacillus sp. PAMC21692]
MDHWKKQLMEQRLEHVRAEMGELSFQEVEFITTGCEKDVLILDKNTVIAFYRKGLQIERYNVRQELLRSLARRTEAVLPECLYCSPNQTFVVEKYVPGSRITPQYVEKKHLESAQQIGRLVGSFLKQLHMTSEQKPVLQTGFAEDVRNDMVEGVKLLQSKLSQSEMEQVKDFLKKYDETSASVQGCIVHGDFHFDNILWDESSGRIGIIDFSETGREDPALDFMYMAYYPMEFRRAVFEEYGSEDTKLYERSQMYDRIYGLYDMIENIQGNPRKPSFEKGYARFFFT